MLPEHAVLLRISIWMNSRPRSEHIDALMGSMLVTLIYDVSLSAFWVYVVSASSDIAKLTLSHRKHRMMTDY